MQLDRRELIPFAEKYHVTVDTVIRRYKKGEIPGIYIAGQKFYVMEGTRYPYKMNGKTRTTNVLTKQFYILEAILNDYYTDAGKLNMGEKDFDDAISELLRRKWIRKRNCQNQCGTNGYCITSEGGKRVLSIREEAINARARNIGNFIGTIIERLSQK